MKTLVILLMSLIFVVGLTPNKSFASHIWANEQDTVNVLQLNNSDTVFVCYAQGLIYFKGGYIDDGGCYDWLFPSGNTHIQFIELFDASIEQSTNCGIMLTRCDGNNRTIRLMFIMPQTSIQNIAICQGQNYTIGSHSYSTSGTYIDTLQAVNSCDSIIITHLIVKPVPVVLATPQTEIICNCDTASIFLTSNVSGTTFNWTTTQVGVCFGATSDSGNIISQVLCNSGGTSCQTYYHIFAIADGCSSNPYDVIVTVELYPSIYMVDYADQLICSGENSNINIYSNLPGTICTWHATASSANVSGFYDFTGNSSSQVLINSGSTPETVTYHITSINNICDGNFLDPIVIVYPSYNLYNPITICQGQTYSIGSHIYTISGTYYDTLQAVHNCDSIITTNLTVEICEGVQENILNKITVFPNPANSKIEILGFNNGTIEIINIQGQIIRNIELINSKNTIDIKELTSGVYTIKIKTENEIIIKKLIKQCTVPDSKYTYFPEYK